MAADPFIVKIRVRVVGRVPVFLEDLRTGFLSGKKINFCYSNVKK